MTLLDRLGDQNDRAAGCRYDEIRDALFREHINRQVQLHLHGLFQLQPFDVQSLLAIEPHTLQHYQLEKFRDVVIQNQP